MKNDTFNQIINANLASIDPGFGQFALAKASSDLMKKVLNKLRLSRFQRITWRAAAVPNGPRQPVFRMRVPVRIATGPDVRIRESYGH